MPKPQKPGHRYDKRRVKPEIKERFYSPEYAAFVEKILKEKRRREMLEVYRAK